MTSPGVIGINLPQSITSDLNYTPKGVAPSGRSYEVLTRPSNQSTFTPSSTAIFEVAGGKQNTYIDSKTMCIRFTVSYALTGHASNTNYIAVNNYANSYIDTLTVYAGGSTVEIINNYGDLASLLMDISLDTASKGSLGRNVGADDSGSPDGHVISVPATTTATYKRTYVLPLMCFLQHCKMFDISELLSGLRFELTWATDSAATARYATARGTAFDATGAGANAFSISDVALIHSNVELDAAGAAMVNSTKDPVNGTMYFSKSARYTSQTITAAGLQVIPGNSRLSSVTSILARFRTLTTATSYNSRSSANVNGNYYQFRIQNLNFPQSQVYLDANDGGYSNAFRNVLSSMNFFGSAHGSALNYVTGGNSSYWRREGGAVATTGIADDATGLGLFCVGVDTELFANRSDVLLSGISTLAQPYYLNYDVATAPSSAATVDMWALYDVIVQVKNGQVIVRM